ncbi:winged helix-turn-helix domain-containing protein [Cellulomonas fimi]|uniref:AfsR/SARP family transcriptional regulator n=1 Tax=Cellulomonas fimi TaxID=1708 RepID=UPI00234C5B88|nr:BTAD domain-containing putative transcriptional regulator [Cellulomonas fimi]MDC7121386.1 winged helix-turn-helix domain-containing protein [Cellulomonas fimi]
MTDRPRYRVLGPLEVRRGGTVVRVVGPQQRALLAVLLAHRGQPVGDDTLADALWPDGPPPSARHTLRTHVSRLRALVGDDVKTLDGGYALDAPADTTDAGAFEAALRTAVDEEPPDAAAALESALASWHGPAFGRAAELPSVAPEARRLDALRLDARQRLAEVLVAAGRPQDAVAVADALTAADPYREPAWAVAVRARTAAGRPADALATYARAAATLDELGLLPGAELRSAQTQALAAGTTADAGSPAPHDAAATPTAGRQPPAPRTSYVPGPGTLDAVRALLDDGRLVTLVGPGGVGKTRAALEVVRVLPAGGARFVELGAVREPDAVPAAVVAAAGLSPAAGPPAEALTALAARDLVLVLDNCEHVVDAVADVVESLLEHPGPLRVLATSREPLRVPGEHVHAVMPLAATDATVLFVDRARAAGAATSVDDPAVGRVVDLLDGLPLALEMAGARAAALSTADLADELAHRLGDLAHAGRGVDARHASLTALVAWSRDLLDPVQRRALDGWPVLASAVPPGDAATVLAVPRHAVEALAARSLLVRDDADGRTRLRMLRTVRAVVGEPPDDDPVRARHAATVADLLGAADARLRGPGEAAARSRLDGLLAEARAAHAWSRRHDVACAVRITRALHDHAVDGLHDEALGWAAQLVADGGGSAHPAAHVSLASRLVLGGRHVEGAGHARRALATADDPVDRMHALEALADAALFEGELDDAAALGDALAGLATRTGAPHLVGVGHSYRVLRLAYTGGTAAARDALARCRDAVDAAAAAASPPGPTTAGWLAFLEGEVEADADPDAALTALRTARDLAAAGGNRYLGGVARSAATALLARHGDPAAVHDDVAEVLRWWREAGDRTHLVTTLRNLLVLLARAGDDAGAATLWGTVVAAHGVPAAYGTERDRLDGLRSTLVGRLGADRFAVLVARGAARTPEQAADDVVAGGPSRVRAP